MADVADVFRHSNCCWPVTHISDVHPLLANVHAAMGRHVLLVHRGGHQAQLPTYVGDAVAGASQVVFRARETSSPVISRNSKEPIVLEILDFEAGVCGAGTHPLPAPFYNPQRERRTRLCFAGSNRPFSTTLHVGRKQPIDRLQQTRLQL